MSLDHFFKFFGGHKSFLWANDTPVLDFWWRLPWVSKAVWIPHLCAFSPAHNGFLRFNSGVTPADLLMASKAVSCVPYLHIADIGC